MELYYSGTNIVFAPSPAYFLGEFDVYDREETLGEYLNRFDPNDRRQLSRLLEELFFEGPRAQSLSEAHKKALIETLASALSDPEYKFSSLIVPEDEDTFSLPFNWEIKKPRMIFEEAYRLAVERWADELSEGKANLPTLAELEIPPLT